MMAKQFWEDSPVVSDGENWWANAPVVDQPAKVEQPAPAPKRPPSTAKVATVGGLVDAASDAGSWLMSKAGMAGAGAGGGRGIVNPPAVAAPAPQPGQRGRTWGEAASDTGTQLAEGVNNIFGAVPNLVAPDGGAAEFFNRNSDFWRDQQSDTIKSKVQGADAAISKAGEEGVISQMAEAASQYFSDPVLAARFVTTNLPSMVPGVAAAKVAQAAALARGATAAKAAGLATTAAGATNAVLNAGGARGEAFEDIKRTLMQQGVPEAQAEEAALRDSRVVAAVGGIAGAISGKTGLESAAIRQAGAGLGRSAVGAGIKSAAVESVGEQLEEVAPKIVTNYQAGQYDGRSVLKDVGRTVVETAIGSGPGAIVSGGMSAANQVANDPARQIAREIDAVQLPGQGQQEQALQTQSQPSAWDIARSKGFMVDPPTKADKPSVQRSKIIGAFQEIGAFHGLGSDVVQAGIDAAQARPLAQVGGFLKRYAAALQKRGVIPADADPDVFNVLDAQPIEPASPEAAKDDRTQGRAQQGQPQSMRELADMIGAAEQALAPTGLADVPQGSLASDAAAVAGMAEDVAAQPQQQQAQQPEQGTPPVVASPVDAAAHQAATSPTNNRAEPTQAQKEAGNYKVGRTRIAGMDIRIENPQGSKRRGVAQDGTPWETEMRAHYGYLAGTEAADGDKLDVFIKPGTEEEWRGPVFVIDQIDPKTGELDEHKVIMGATDEAEAEAIYRSNYDANWQGLGAITRLPLPAFKGWAKSGRLKEPLGDIANRPQLAPDRKPQNQQAPAGAPVGKVGGSRPALAVQAAAPEVNPAPVPADPPKIAGNPVTEIQIGKLLRYANMRGASERVRQVAAAEVKRRETEFVWAQRERDRAAQELAIVEQARDQQVTQAVATSLAGELDAPGAMAEAFSRALQKSGKTKKEPVEPSKTKATQASAGGAAPPSGDVIVGKPVAEMSLDQLRRITEMARASDAAKAKAAREIERRAAKDAERDNKARADLTVDDFQLGQSADQQLSGMDDLFAQQADPDASQGDVVVGSRSVPATKPDAKIEDFGEKLAGARKDYAAKLKDSMDVDVAAEPLSKSWPEPDYQKLLEGGADPYTVAFIHAARDEIPTKPVKAWKLKGWVDGVKTLRGMSSSLFSGDVSADQLRQKLASPEFTHVRNKVGGRAELYQFVGHSKSLKGVTFEEHFYSLYRGEKNVHKWSVEQQAKATAFSNWPREIVVADTKDEAIEAFKAKYGELDLGAKAKGQPQFIIYRKRGQEGAFIGKKIGREHIDLKKVSSVDEARTYLENNTADLERALERYKATPMERRADNAPRVGDDHRNGAPVTPEAFADTFGFRGVQFGNYVEQGRRQSDLNEAYDALMDLAAVLGVDPRALSLNGGLGLAFGARGKGGKNAPAAHFEPANLVINLTKGGGPGSLAHEWWHATDNYFARQSVEKSTDFVTDGAVTTNMRRELREAFASVKAATTAPTLRRRSAELDKRRSKPYWNTPLELSARAFESYVIAKLQDQGAANDYLANIADPEVWGITESMRSEALGRKEEPTYPYPLQAELPTVRAAFDDFFKVVETREDEMGNVAMFSVESENSPTLAGGDVTPSGGPISKVELDSIIKSAHDGWKGLGGGRIVAAESWQDLPESILEQAEEMGFGLSGIEGVLHGGRVYLIRSALKSREQAERVLFHEVFGHMGVKVLMASGANKSLDDLWLQLNGLAGVRRLASKIDVGGGATAWDRLQKYIKGTEGGDQTKRRAVIMDELIAFIAQANDTGALTQFKGYLSDLKAAVVGVLRKLNLTTLASRLDRAGAELDVLAMVRDARNSMITGVTPGGAAFSFVAPRAAAFSDDQDSRFSVADGFTLPEFEALEKTTEALQDRYNRWKQVVEAARAQGGTVTEANDFYQAEERYWGIVGAQLDDFRGEVETFVGAVRSDDLELSDVALYAYAKHAPERNAQIAKINPKFPEGGSGMTDAEAEAIIDKAKADGLGDKLERHAETLHKWTEGTRKALLKNGLISQEEYDDWTGAYRSYVPLRGRVGDDGSRRSTGSGFDVRGKETFRAMGRSSRADNIIEHVMQDRSRALLRAGKNEVLRRFARFVLDNPDAKLWEINAVERTRTIRKTPSGEQVFDNEALNKDQADTVALKDGGQTIYITVKDAKLLEQLKNLNNSGDPAVLAPLLMANRHLSRVYTSLSPTFVVFNAARDIAAGSINMAGVAGYGAAAGMIGNLPAAYREAVNAEVRGKPSKAYDEYRRSGGKTGFMDFKNIEGYTGELQAMLDMSRSWGEALDTPGKLRKAMAVWRKGTKYAALAIDRIEDVNAAVENATRFAAFKTARESGKSVAEAASIAKNITVNFNRRGAMTTHLSALFLFFNPAVQGIARTAQALKTREVQTLIGSAMVGVFMLALRNAAFGGDDEDDGMTYWDKIPASVKERNLVIMLPPGSDAGEAVPGSKHGRYIKIPMPYGYNAFAVTAQVVADMWRNQQDPRSGVTKAEGSARIADAFLGAWFPVSDAAPSIENPASAVLIAVPDALDPLGEIAVNANGFGNKMSPDEGYKHKYLPDSEKVWDSQKNTWKHKTARWVNEVTGGSLYHEGAVSVTPAAIESLARGYGGGITSFISDLADAVVTRSIDRDGFEWWRAPFARQLYGEVGMAQDQALVYDRLDKIEEGAKPLAAASKDGAREAEQAIRKEFGEVLTLGKLANDTRKRMSEIRKNENQIISSGRTDKEKMASLRQWNLEREKAYARLNRAFNDAAARERTKEGQAAALAQ